MRALDIKLFRDVRRLWAQVLAIALVVGGGVATLVLAVGSHRSLEETRIAYYERYGFADVFAQVKRAPKALTEQIMAIPGVAAVDVRIAKLALLDVSGFSEPASAQFVSWPDSSEPVLNRLYMRSGRMPEPGRAEEVVVNEPFAKAHGFAEGARFSAILNGKKRELVIVGTALSPEFVYTVGPGDLMPDDRRYAITISGRPADSDLRRIIDGDLRPVAPPESGLAISSMLAHILGAKVDDSIEVDLLDGARRTVTLPIVATVEDSSGIKGMMDMAELSRLMREVPVVNSVNLSLDENRKEEFYAAVKSMPTVSGVALQRVSLANFRKTIALLITTMASIYTGLAAVITFGVVYNNARTSLSERARELASLRVLGFTRGEVLRILLLELAILALIAQPPGWVLGYGLAWVMKTSLAGELMRVRLVVEHSTYVTATAVVVTAAIASAAIIRDRINKLDLVAVLKTRD